MNYETDAILKKSKKRKKRRSKVKNKLSKKYNSNKLKTNKRKSRTRRRSRKNKKNYSKKIYLGGGDWTSYLASWMPSLGTTPAPADPPAAERTWYSPELQYYERIKKLKVVEYVSK